MYQLTEANVKNFKPFNQIETIVSTVCYRTPIWRSDNPATCNIWFIQSEAKNIFADSFVH